ncbi:MAG: hypothetical protein KGL39_52105 [Patescibacteria group bacterium]|nr:hypothetical protein [Patescibacteria group bacterium]
MAYSKKHYRSFANNRHQSRGGIKGHAVDTSFGAPGNLHRSKKNYGKRRDA